MLVFEEYRLTGSSPWTRGWGPLVYATYLYHVEQRHQNEETTAEDSKIYLKLKSTVVNGINTSQKQECMQSLQTKMMYTFIYRTTVLYRQHREVKSDHEWRKKVCGHIKQGKN